MDLTIWKNNTSPRPRILWQFRTPPNSSTLKEASIFTPFGVDAKCLNHIPAGHLLFQVSRFLTRRGQVLKNLTPEYRWPEIASVFCGEVLVQSFRKSTKRWLESDFFGVKNVWKKMKFQFFELLHGSFIHWDQVSGRVPKSIQNPIWNDQIWKFNEKW